MKDLVLYFLDKLKKQTEIYTLILCACAYFYVQTEEIKEKQDSLLTFHFDNDECLVVQHEDDYYCIEIFKEIKNEG